MWRSILSSSSRVGVDFSASCNNSLSSVERVNSSTPPSNGLRGANLSLGMKWSKGRPSLRPIPRKLIMRSCAEFYKSMLLFRATYAHLIHKSIGPLVAASKRLAKVTTTHRKLPFNSLAGGRTNVLPFALRCTPESAEPASCLCSTWRGHARPPLTFVATVFGAPTAANLNLWLSLIAAKDCGRRAISVEQKCAVIEFCASIQNCSSFI